MATVNATTSAELRHHDDVLVMVVHRNLLALAWYDAPRPGHLLEVLRTVEDLHRRNGFYGLLNVVVRGTPSFPEQVREEGRRLIQETTGWGGVTAHVMEVEGFAGTAARMFLSTMMLVGRGRSSNAQFFGDHHTGCEWLAPRLTKPERPWSIAELENVYADLRARQPKPRVEPQASARR